MRRRVSILCGALWLVLTGGAAPGRAQTAPAAEDLFTDTLDVTAVDVEVVVTDRKGNPVPGLKASDFRLLVDGKPAAIESFAEVRDGAVPAAPPADPGAAPVPVPQETAPGQEVPRSYLVFIDEYFTPPTMRNEALRGIAREISTLRPVDRMAVVAFNGRKLKVLAPWMSPDESLRKMLETLSQEKASLAASPFSIADLEPSANQLLEQYSNALDSAGRTGSLINGSATEMLAASLVERSIDAATHTLRGFAAVPGRKLLVLLSGGWAYDLRVKKKTLDQRERLRPLIDTCNLLGYTVYPIHLAQSSGARLPSAGAGAVSASAGIGPVNGGAGSPTQNSLIATAEETGGKMLLPGRNRHLSRIVEDTRSYYWLGLTHTGDERRHDLKVEVTRPDLQVRARSSFLPLARPARTAIDMERALLTGDAAGLRALDVTVGALEPAGKDTAEVPVTLRIPTADLSFAQREGRNFVRLELRTAALDADGQRSDVPLIPINIESDESPKPGSFIRYDTRVRVRRTSQDLLLLVYDTLSGKSFAKKVRLVP